MSAVEDMAVSSSVRTVMAPTRVPVTLATGLKQEWPAHATVMVRESHSVALATSTHCLPDIDECAEGTDACEHNCHNNAGSYTCSCNFGFQLYDGFHCRGM